MPSSLTFQLRPITNSTLNITRSTFSLQDALDPFGSGSNMAPQTVGAYNEYTLFLFSTGCGSDPNQQNCSVTCGNASTIFSNLETLHNCMTYPAVAELYDTLPPEQKDFADTLGIESSRSNASRPGDIVDAVQKCLLSYCETLSGCKDYAEVRNDSFPESSLMNATSDFYYQNLKTTKYSDYSFDLCDFITPSLNQDIGGIGVCPFEFSLKVFLIVARCTCLTGSKLASPS